VPDGFIASERLNSAGWHEPSSSVAESHVRTASYSSCSSSSRDLNVGDRVSRYHFPLPMSRIRGPLPAWPGHHVLVGFTDADTHNIQPRKGNKTVHGDMVRSPKAMRNNVTCPDLESPPVAVKWKRALISITSFFSFTSCVVVVQNWQLVLHGYERRTHSSTMIGYHMLAGPPESCSQVFLHRFGTPRVSD
jgi:hypothetical protein